MKIALERIEFLPEGSGVVIGGAEFGEVGPIVLHGAGKLELLGIERWPRHGDGQIEEVLNLGGVSGGVGKRNRRQEILRGVLIVELIGGERDELRHRDVGS